MAPTWITPLLGNHLVAQLITELVSAPPPSTLSNKKKSFWKLWVCKTIRGYHELTCSDTFVLTCVSFTPRSLHFYMKNSPGNMRENRGQLASLSSKLTRRKSLVTCLGTSCCLYTKSAHCHGSFLGAEILFESEKNISEQRNQVLPQWEAVVWKGRPYSILLVLKARNYCPNGMNIGRSPRSTLESQAETKWIVRKTLNIPKFLSEELNHWRTSGESLNLWGSVYKRVKWGNTPCHPST